MLQLTQAHIKNDGPYRWATFSSMVQLVPLGFKVLAEGLLQGWTHPGHRPDIQGSKEKNKRHSTHPLPNRSWSSYS